MRHLFLRWGVSLALVFSLVVTAWPDHVQAHKPESHSILTEKAVEISGVSFCKPWDVLRIMQGSIDEDLKGILRMQHHFFNPHTLEAGKTPGARTAKFQAGELWWLMEQRFDNPESRWWLDWQEGHGSLHTLGRILHLLQDMASPPHTHSPDGHGWLNKFGPGSILPFYSDFEEKWDPTSSVYAGWPFPSVPEGPLTPAVAKAWTSKGSIPGSRLDAHSFDEMMVKLRAIPNLPRDRLHREYMDALAWITYYHSSFYGRIQKNENHPAPVLADLGLPDNVLRQMFPNRIGFSGSWWDDYWVIDGVGYYDKKGRYLKEDWWPCPGAYPEGSQKSHHQGASKGLIEGRFYIYLHYYQDTGVVYGLAVPPNRWPDGTQNNNTTLARYYGNVLLPLAIGFTAGLIEEVFPAPRSLSYPMTGESTGYTVNWEAPPATPAGAPVGYRLERSGDFGASWWTVYTGTQTAYDENNARPGDFSYRVRAQWFDDCPIYGVQRLGDQRTPIRNWFDLHAIRANLSGHYVLMNHLDHDTDGWLRRVGPLGWEPIGTSTNPFTGTFDGQGYEIRDLFIHRPAERGVGLFGYVSGGAVIRDVGVTDATVTGDDFVGALVGCLGTSLHPGTIITNSYSTGSVTGNQFTGGLVGDNRGIVSRSYSTCSVTGEYAVGGLAGITAPPSTVDHSYAAGSVTGQEAVGGLVGYHGGTVYSCYSNCTVTGARDRIGGLVGANDHGVVRNAYASGSVTGQDAVGGLVGDNYKGTVRNSYSTGPVTGNSNVGGLLGFDYEGTVTGSFWDTQTSGMQASAGGYGKTTAEMTNIATFDLDGRWPGKGWHIVGVGGIKERNTSYVWNIVDGQTYPFLSWQRQL